MPLGKRELARIGRRLITTLTEACETTKGEIKDFTWLTHTADLNASAETLKVILVFKTLADRKLAVVDAKARIFEEECQRTHGVDWKNRLTQSRVAKGD